MVIIAKQQANLSDYGTIGLSTIIEYQCTYALTLPLSNIHIQRWKLLSVSGLYVAADNKTDFGQNQRLLVKLLVYYKQLTTI